MNTLGTDQRTTNKVSFGLDLMKHSGQTASWQSLIVNLIFGDISSLDKWLLCVCVFFSG